MATGIVDQDIQPLQAAEESRGSPRCRGRRRRRASTDKPSAAQFAFESCQRRSVAAIDDDMGAGLGQRPRHGAAQMAAAARNKGSLAVQTEKILRPLVPAAQRPANTASRLVNKLFTLSPAQLLQCNMLQRSKCATVSPYWKQRPATVKLQTRSQ